MSITPAVSILIVSYNTREMTLACLRSVFEQTTRTLFELIVVDNLSSDGSADAIEAEFDGRLVLIRSEENLGFARANNLAAERATGEYLLLLNPDTVVLDGAIDRLVEFAGRRPDADPGADGVRRWDTQSRIVLAEADGLEHDVPGRSGCPGCFADQASSTPGVRRVGP